MRFTSLAILLDGSFICVSSVTICWPGLPIQHRPLMIFPIFPSVFNPPNTYSVYPPLTSKIQESSNQTHVRRKDLQRHIAERVKTLEQQACNLTFELRDKPSTGTEASKFHVVEGVSERTCQSDVRLQKIRWRPPMPRAKYRNLVRYLADTADLFYRS